MSLGHSQDMPEKPRAQYMLSKVPQAFVEARSCGPHTSLQSLGEAALGKAEYETMTTKLRHLGARIAI